MGRRTKVATGAAVAATAISGIVQFGLPLREDVLPPVGLVLYLLWIGLPFVPVVIAASRGRTNNLALGVAFGVALASTFIVHRVVEASIEDDPSSTAGIIHIYDPFIGCLAVGLALGEAWALRVSR